MSLFNSAVLTIKGNEILINAAAGKQIEFTRMVTGCGIYTEEEKKRSYLETAAALKDQRQQFGISWKEMASEKCVKLTALITNKELSEGYKMTEIGVYARQVGMEEEFLCSIAVTKSLEETDSFPPYNGFRECEIAQDYYITISPDAEVTVKTQGAAALADDLIKLQGKVDAIPKFVFGPEDMVIENNTILFVTDEGGAFDAANFINMTIQEEPPETVNWGTPIRSNRSRKVAVVDGILTVSKEPERDTVFWGKIKEEN